MADSSGQTYSQGMMAGSGSWAGEIYSQGMMMSSGDIYSQGMEITMLGGTTNSQSTDTAADLGGTTIGGTTNSEGTGGVTNLGGTANSPPASQGCVGTAPNCTYSVTDTASVSGPHNDGSADPLLSGSAYYVTFVSSGPLNIVGTEPIPEPAGLALLAPTLLWFGLWGGVGATKRKEDRRSPRMLTAP
jgi:hypothetical protein